MGTWWVTLASWSCAKGKQTILVYQTSSESALLALQVFALLQHQSHYQALAATPTAFRQPAAVCRAQLPLHPHLLQRLANRRLLLPSLHPLLLPWQLVLVVCPPFVPPRTNAQTLALLAQFVVVG